MTTAFSKKDQAVAPGIANEIDQIGLKNLSQDALDAARRDASQTNILDGKLSPSDLLTLKPGVDQEFSQFVVKHAALIKKLDMHAQEAARNPSLEGGASAMLVAEIERLSKIFDASNKIQPDMNTLEADMNRALGIMAHFNEASNS